MQKLEHERRNASRTSPKQYYADKTRHALHPVEPSDRGIGEEQEARYAAARRSAKCDLPDRCMLKPRTVKSQAYEKRQGCKAYEYWKHLVKHGQVACLIEELRIPIIEVVHADSIGKFAAKSIDNGK